MNETEGVTDMENIRQSNDGECKRLIILGSGGYGQVVADVAEQIERYDSIRFLDDNDTRDDVLGKCDDYASFSDGNTEFYPAFGNNELRIKWINELLKKGMNVATIIHQTAYVSPTVTVGVGTVILPKAAINRHTTIGKGVLINMGALIDHNCTLGDGCHICLGAMIKADNHIPAGLKIEAGQVIENRTYRSEINGNQN